MTYISLFKFKKDFILIYYSSDKSESSEEIYRSSVICLVTFFIFQCIYILLKTLFDNSFHLF